MNPNTLLNYLPAYKGKEKILKDQQTTNDIINEILKGHKQYADQYKNISSFFVGSTPKNTLYNIWSFLKKEVKYVVEPEAKQTIKSPAAIIATGKTTGSDCKNYSLFIGGILQNVNESGSQKIPFCFRFTGYKFFDSNPQHVFIVAYPDTSKEIWIDAVLNKFDYKKPFTLKIDKKPMLVGISGIGAKPKTFAGKILRPVLKVAAAPARNAFLLLVGLNFIGLATKLDKANFKQPKALMDWWERLGGRIQNLLGMIKRGKDKKRIFGYEYSGEIGADPITDTTATAAVASPILAAVAVFLKDILKEAQPELQQIASKFIVEKAQNVAYRQSLSKVDRKLMDQQKINEFERSNQVESGNQVQSGNLMKYAPLILVAGAGLYFLTKKK
jgi:hypothetical protein